MHVVFWYESYDGIFVSEVGEASTRVVHIDKVSYIRGRRAWKEKLVGREADKNDAIVLCSKESCKCTN